jgi:hypothetical protein
MSSTDSRFLALWSELCSEVSGLGKDVEKSVKRNVSAGIRVRKGLREIRKQAAFLLKESLTTDKAIVEERKTKRQAAS